MDSLRSLLTPWGMALGTLLLPFRCRHCSRLIGQPHLLCLSCHRILASCRIPKAELPGWSPAGRPCLAVSYYRAGSPLRSVHHAAKFHADEHASRFMERYLVRGLTSLQPADCVVPVPSHPARLRDRGLDLTGRLGVAVARSTGAPSRPDLLRRTHLGQPQNDLDREGRIANVKGVFEASTDVRPGMRIILVDDVVTTGATLDAAAAPLEQRGALVALLALAFRRELF